MPIPAITDFLYPLQWNLQLMDVENAWNELYSMNPNIALGDSSIIIAVVDNGIHSTTVNGVTKAVHPDLEGNAPGLGTPKVVAFLNSPAISNFFNNDQPLSNHGSSVACIISGAANGQGTVGVAPNTRLIGIIKPILTNGTLASDLPDIFRWSTGLKSYQSNLLSEGASIINFSLEYIEESDYIAANQIAADKSIRDTWDAVDDITSFGRSGLGALLLAGAGNGEYNAISGKIEGVDLIKGTRLGIYKKVICVGATKYTAPNVAATPTESIADYSNFGPQLDLVAPAGIAGSPPPGSNFIPNQAFTTFTGSNFNGGNCTGTSDFQLTLKNNVTANPALDAELRVDSLEGIFPGQSILIHSSNAFTSKKVDMVIVKDIQTDTGTPPNKIITTPLRFNHNINDLLSVGTQITKLTLAANSTDSSITVNNTFGFYVTQEIIIGNLSGTHETKIINAIDPVNNTLSFATGLSGAHALGSIVISKAKFETVYVQTYVSNSILEVTAGSGLFNGQKIGVEVPTINTVLHGGKNINFYEEYTLTRSTMDTSGAFALLLDRNMTAIHTVNSSVIRARYGHYTSEFTGTSAATPFVSGVAALVLSAKPNLNWLEVRDFLRTTADKIGSLAYSPAGQLGRNDYYGHGRVNAHNAVLAAKNYSYDHRDLMIRDFIGDAGLIPTTVTVDSPDIWVRNLPDTTYSPPANYNTAGPHQTPVLSVDKKIYVRVKNIGTTLASIEGAEVRCFIAFTNDVDPTFLFPDYWKENLNAAGGENVQFIGSKELTSVNSLADTTITIDWLSSFQISNPNNLNAYLLVHISPFDRGVTANTVQANNNLTYKPLTFSATKYKSGTGTGSLQKVVPVDTDGTPETLPFEIELDNTKIAFANNIEINATITYRDATPVDNVTFKYNGSSWAFVTAPASPWILLNAPVLSGSTAGGNQELTVFNGSLTLDNTVLSVAFSTKQYDGSAAIISSEPYALNVVFNFPEPADGISAEQKTTIYTFTDFDQLPVQTGLNNFGPVSSALTTEYRTWNAFTGISSGTVLKAYAVTNGEFFIQEITGNANAINLILKPDNQPDNKIGLVKYYVYRGLRKDSFLQSSGQVLPSSTSGMSELLTRMWAVRTILDTESAITDVIYRSDLGLDETGTLTPTPGTTLVEDFFDTYVFQKLSPGMHIGNFYTAGDYGVQVIVEGPNYKPTLDDLKVLDHKAIITYAPGQPTFAGNAEEDIKSKIDREKILSFVDSAAYFGLLAHGNIELKKSSGSTTIKNDAAQVNNEIIVKFATKNKVYVDIRNELNNSLNFYGSYSDTTLPTKVAVLNFNNTTNTMVPKEYHTEGWPILTLSTADFTAGTGDFIKAKFELPQGDNLYPGLFLSGASFFADGLNYKNKFQVLTTASSYTNAFELSIGNLGSPATVLPFIIKLSYTRRYDIDNLPAIPSVLTRPWKDDYLDNILCINETNITPPSSDPTYIKSAKWNTYSELKYIGWTSLKGFDLAIRSGVAKESIGNTLYCFSYGASELEDATSFSGTHSNLVLEKGLSTLHSVFYALKEKTIIDFSYYEIPVSSANIKTINVASNNDNLSIDILNKSGDDFFSVSLDSTSYASIQSAISTNFLANATVYLVAYNHQLNADNLNYPYYVFEIGLNAVSQTSNNVSRINTTIKVYSINGKNYFTEAYADALKTLIDTNANNYNDYI
jgi:hypothetical protein